MLQIQPLGNCAFTYSEPVSHKYISNYTKWITAVYTISGKGSPFHLFAHQPGKQYFELPYVKNIDKKGAGAGKNIDFLSSI
jgi:hypothetical protein